MILTRVLFHSGQKESQSCSRARGKKCDTEWNLFLINFINAHVSTGNLQAIYLFNKRYDRFVQWYCERGTEKETMNDKNSSCAQEACQAFRKKLISSTALMGPANPTQKIQLSVEYFGFLKPKTNKERCQTWIKQSGRPHEHLNLSTINENTFICACCHCYMSIF